MELATSLAPSSNVDHLRIPIDAARFPKTIEGFGDFQCLAAAEALELRSRLPFIAHEIG